MASSRPASSTVTTRTLDDLLTAARTRRFAVDDYIGAAPQPGDVGMRQMRRPRLPLFGDTAVRTERMEGADDPGARFLTQFAGETVIEPFTGFPGAAGQVSHIGTVVPADDDVVTDEADHAVSVAATAAGS